MKSGRKKGCIPWNKGKKGLQKSWNKLPFYPIPSLCECGYLNCHEIIWNGRKYAQGHSTRINNPFKNKHHSLETIKIIQEKVSKKLTGKKRPSHSKRMSGKFNPNWKGGSSFIPYCFKFNDKLREAVRIRDNHICQLCNKTQEENKRKLDVHHIHYDKENCYPDLITLCNMCNGKVNFNRLYYESLFMNKLNDRQLLFWTIYGY